MTINELITEMQQVKQDNPALEIADVLRIFEIQAIKDLIAAIRIAGGRR